MNREPTIGDEIPIGGDPAALIGAIEHSGGDESVNHDHYLYGWPREETCS